MDAQEPHKISNVAAAGMLGVALILDLVQFLLTLAILTVLVNILITFLAVCIFGIWFAVMGINYFQGRKAGLKVLSSFGATIIELVPVIDGLPGITAGVLGIIVSSRLEERTKSVQKSTPGASSIRFGPQKIPQAANDDGEDLREAA
jgi:hypothetical protein